MTNKKIKEWYVDVPWGKVAIISWGDAHCSPMLLIHGYMDSAATHTFLVEQLPDTYYYVAFDIPGHGKSDPCPPGLPFNPFHIVEVIKNIVQDMGWKNFILMAHSMGCLIGLYYHHIFPDFITRMIFLDPMYPLSIYYLIQDKTDIWFDTVYSDYFGNFKKWHTNVKVYTYESALHLFVRYRDLTEEQAKVMLSRSLIKVGEDAYKLSWEPRAKKFTFFPLSEETMYTIMSKKVPPTICIDASKSFEDTAYIVPANNILKRCEKNMPHFYRVRIDGGHDSHITDPEVLVPLIKTFLENNEKSYGNVFKKQSNL